ncbi:MULTISPECIES: glycine zipper 2TM domain-containing protein [unclassified Sulfuricurvum]|uniref:glycine zipper 2TM domain-containing protein n=1 Tax=unclassified Sulfuricurvum TaxID=2632390 RepID=UPI0002998BE0|nr:MULTISPECIES: glycine zipper 2TM domain-containing protein [unclassified Sulfuricurvum]AFV97323.1 17 kda surface antigen [Candidatus Sulfuricurvum sp. RIFRC-1]HBM34972.1 glycine zipper 2TM domain-containing protein [Sulfuricurvum sp.]
MSKIILPVALSVLFSTSAVMAENFSTVEYVNVIRSTPNYSTIQEEVPSQKCYDVQEQVSSGGTNNDVIGAVVGGALGGVLGHQVGGGKGKTAATVGGAVLGTLAGQNVGSKYNTPSSTTYQTVRKCENITTVKTRQVVDGYINYAKFKGREISVESNSALKQIPVTVTYSY